jgi:outer membrane protein OmpA-like peptidoglycan-associated protein/tetratricopeptide (TPR) repeat protein
MKYTFILLILFQTSLAFSQSEQLVRGDFYFEKQGYYQALNCFERVKESEFESAEMQQKLAFCYNFCGEFSKAEVIYKKLIAKKAEPQLLYQLAYSLARQNKNDEANAYFQQFATANPTDLRAQLFLKDPGYLAKLIAQEPHFKIAKTGLNTDHADFGVYPIPGKNEAMIVSSRRFSYWGNPKWAGDNEQFLDLYTIELVKDKTDNAPKYLQKPLNSGMHEGPACFSADGQVMYFTADDKKGNANGMVNLKIYRAFWKNGIWADQQELPINSNTFSTGHPVLSADGKTLYFVSDRPGGFGGSDIYSVAVDAKGKLGAVKNLGANINTEGNEMFPWINGDLFFFASNGRPGFGGLDVFVAPLGFEVAAVNAGTVINTQADDFAVSFFDNSNLGFIASNRVGGLGGDDIYGIEMIKTFVFPISFKGTALDGQSGAIMAGATIVIKDETGAVIATLTADAKGQFNTTLDPGKSYTIEVSKEGFNGGSKNIAIAEKAKSYQEVFKLEKKPAFMLELLLTNAQTKGVIPGAQILIKDLTTKAVLFNNTTDQAGTWQQALENMKLGNQLAYEITLTCNGYLSKTLTYQEVINKEGIIALHEKLNVAMTPISVGGDLAKTLGIKPIYFDLGKYNIRKDAAIELDKIVKVMNENPTMVIELGSHTDCRSSIQFNETLSANRAKASAAYIKQRISKPERIYGKGYGESRLLNDCGCEGTVKSTCTEAEHQLNRRTEFIIIKM